MDKPLWLKILEGEEEDGSSGGDGGSGGAGVDASYFKSPMADRRSQGKKASPTLCKGKTSKNEPCQSFACKGGGGLCSIHHRQQQNGTQQAVAHPKCTGLSSNLNPCGLNAVAGSTFCPRHSFHPVQQQSMPMQQPVQQPVQQQSRPMQPHPVQQQRVTMQQRVHQQRVTAQNHMMAPAPAQQHQMPNVVCINGVWYQQQPLPPLPPLPPMPPMPPMPPLQQYYQPAQPMSREDYIRQAPKSVTITGVVNRIMYDIEQKNWNMRLETYREVVVDAENKMDKAMRGSPTDMDQIRKCAVEVMRMRMFYTVCQKYIQTNTR
jgi:hypothetical protein